MPMQLTYGLQHSVVISLQAFLASVSIEQLIISLLVGLAAHIQSPLVVRSKFTQKFNGSYFHSFYFHMQNVHMKYMKISTIQKFSFIW